MRERGSERGREREGERERERAREKGNERDRGCVYVCVCLRGGGSRREKKTIFLLSFVYSLHTFSSVINRREREHAEKLKEINKQKNDAEK